MGCSSPVSLSKNKIVPKPTSIELTTGDLIPIVYEDRSVLAIDKPAGWMLVPFSWQKTSHNLQAAIVSSIASGAFWARSRNIKFLRYVHRLDAETSGILLFARSQGALDTFGDLFENRQMDNTYLAIVEGIPKQMEWECESKLGPDPRKLGRVIVDERNGKDAHTFFRVVHQKENRALVEARPVTGRTHQIRVHLARAGLPVVGDELYGRPPAAGQGKNPKLFPLGLRAVHLSYKDPFTRKPVEIAAPSEKFIQAFGFTLPASRT
jgi:23S rRNA pseudouridine1911/1915/1917 synthase